MFFIDFTADAKELHSDAAKLSSRAAHIKHAQINGEVPEISEIPGGNEAILIIDSDPAVRKVLSTLLSLKGYQLLLAEDGEEGRRVFSANQDDIKLIMTETIMPKKNSRQMYLDICRIKEGVPVIFLGHGDDTDIDPDLPVQNSLFLQKPIKRPSLLAKVREALDSRRVAVPEVMSG